MVDELKQKWENEECTYPLCPIQNMVQLNCKGCPVVSIKNQEKRSEP